MDLFTPTGQDPPRICGLIFRPLANLTLFRVGIIRFVIPLTILLDRINQTMVWHWSIEGTIVIRLRMFITLLYFNILPVGVAVPRVYLFYHMIVFASRLALEINDTFLVSHIIQFPIMKIFY